MMSHPPHEQPAWGFRDKTGMRGYELTRVYGPPVNRDRRGPVSRLDEKACYWETTGGVKVARITWADARRLCGSHMTFARFSSLSEMRDELPGLLQAKPAPPRSVSGSGEVDRFLVARPAETRT